MQALFGEVSKRIPDRWLTQSLGPGTAWSVTAFAAYLLGHADPFMLTVVANRTEQLADQLRVHPTTVVLVCALAVAVATAVSLAARGAGSAVQVVWLGQWTGPARGLATRLVLRRRIRRRAQLTARNETIPDAYLPSRPTWIGDRVHLVDVRVHAQYGLYLALIWPRLWQLVDTDIRMLVQETRTRFEYATRLAGWSICYGALTVVWWPACILALGLFCYAWRRGRLAVGLFADTVETTVDLHHRDLAEALGHIVESDRPLSTKTANAINDQLHKGASPQPHPTGGDAPTEEIA